MSSVHYDTGARVFFLRLRESYYALQIAADGQLMHLGSGPIPENAPENWSWSHLDAYCSEFLWDHHCDRQELPAFGDVSYHDIALKAEFIRSPETPPIRDLRLRYASHEIRHDAEPGLAPLHGLSPNVTTPRETLLIRLRDIEFQFFVTLAYRVTPEHDILERWLVLENNSDCRVHLFSLAFGALSLPAARWEVTHAAGHWAREFVPARHRLVQGTFQLDQRGLNTGHASNPTFLLNEEGAATEEAGPVWFGALAYSGNWNIRFDLLPTGSLRIFAGYEPDDFSLTLAPAESHTTPAFLHGCASDGRGGASRRLHSFIREQVLPGWPQGEYRPVLYNSWESTYFDVTEHGQIALAREAAELGVELFCVDDGWFGNRSDDSKGLGDWTPRTEAFPRGLGPLVEEVKRLGMKFGLWVEPEMVNPDSALYRAHPDWILHFPNRPRTQIRNQHILDFGRPEVIEHLFNVLDRLVREQSVDFFKWDMNRYATEPGSVAGLDIWHAHVAGVYKLMDQLRCNHPQLAIQSCSGGGGRIDMGIMARTDQVWTSDNTDAHDRTLIQEGFSLFYAARTMESWVTHATNHQTGRISSLDLRFDVAMRGTLGLGLDLDRLTGEEIGICRRKINFYKTIRPTIQNGDLYRLAQISENNGFSIWLYVSPDREQAVYSFIRLLHLQGHHMGPIRLRGLKADAPYAVTDEFGSEIGLFSGAQLMYLGLPGDDAQGGLGHTIRSRTLRLQQTTLVA